MRESEEREREPSDGQADSLVDVRAGRVKLLSHIAIFCCLLPVILFAVAEIYYSFDIENLTWCGCILS